MKEADLDCLLLHKPSFTMLRRAFSVLRSLYSETRDGTP